jgi:transposase-like protein
LNKKVYVDIDEWRTRKLHGRYPYVYLDGIYLKRSWGGEFENVSILVAIGVDEDGYREVLGASEGMKEDKTSWSEFLKGLKERGLSGTRLFIGDKCMGLFESVCEVYPEAKYQRCTVHFYRNMFSVTPRSKVREVAAMLKAIHAQEDKASAREKAELVTAKLRGMKLKEAADKSLFLHRKNDIPIESRAPPTPIWLALPRCFHCLEICRHNVFLFHPMELNRLFSGICLSDRVQIRGIG